jgi:hypothetical protein
MNHHPTNSNYPKTFPFSPFVSGANKSVGSASDWKRTVGQLLSKRTRPAPPSRPLSRYELNVYGCPRVLSRWEVIVQALAWPVLVGVVIGYGLAISLVAIHDSSMSAPQSKASPSLVEAQETAQ